MKRWMLPGLIAQLLVACPMETRAGQSFLHHLQRQQRPTLMLLYVNPCPALVWSTRSTCNIACIRPFERVCIDNAQCTKHRGQDCRDRDSHAVELGVVLKLGAAELPFCTASWLAPSSTTATCIQRHN